MTIQSYRDLDVWQKAMDFVVDVYAVTNNFPKAEVYGLTSQMRRAAVSVPSNIAEGRSRKSTLEFGKFLSIAYGSLAELQTQIEIAQRLDYIATPNAGRLLERSGEIGRMLNGLMSSLNRRSS